MVDCRTAGAPPQEINGSAPDNHTQQSGGGDVGNTVSSSARASTPATTNSITTYTGGNPPLTHMSSSVPYNCAPYMCGVKSVVWCAPHSPQLAGAHAPPPPPHGVNPHVYKSVQANGADLPMNDIPTLRYYFNLGVECTWAAYGPPQPPPHAPHHPPPRHYSPAAVAQDMQQMSLHERPHDKHKPNDKPLGPSAPKGNGQRPLLGPRFKRGNNQDNNQSNNHNQNKGHNNNMSNKGPNNRRNSYVDNRTPSYEEGTVGVGGGVVEAPLLTFPYAPYPPPIYPVPYYHIDEPAMMGMMSGMNTMGYMYEEGMEFGVQPVYPPYPPVPHPHTPHVPQVPHPPHVPHTPQVPHVPHGQHGQHVHQNVHAHAQPIHEHK